MLLNITVKVILFHLMNILNSRSHDTTYPVFHCLYKICKILKCLNVGDHISNKTLCVHEMPKQTGHKGTKNARYS